MIWQFWRGGTVQSFHFSKIFVIFSHICTEIHNHRWPIFMILVYRYLGYCSEFYCWYIWTIVWLWLSGLIQPTTVSLIQLAQLDTSYQTPFSHLCHHVIIIVKKGDHLGGSPCGYMNMMWVSEGCHNIHPTTPNSWMQISPGDVKAWLWCCQKSWWC